MNRKLKVLAVALIAGSTMFAQPRVSSGIGVGGYGPGAYPPPDYAHCVPPCPGPDYTWVDGYWVFEGGRRVWTAGYWRRPFVSDYRVAPRYVERRHYSAYRENERHEIRSYSNSYRR
jgi:hypothetical protein